MKVPRDNPKTSPEDLVNEDRPIPYEYDKDDKNYGPIGFGQYPAHGIEYDSLNPAIDCIPGQGQRCDCEKSGEFLED